MQHAMKVHQLSGTNTDSLSAIASMHGQTASTQKHLPALSIKSPHTAQKNLSAFTCPNVQIHSMRHTADLTRN